MKLGEGKVDGQPRDSQVSRERSRGGKPRGAAIEASGDQLIANVTVELLVKRFARHSVEPNHLESDDSSATALLDRLFIYDRFHNSDAVVNRRKPRD
jgi:hypothetical protein